MFTVYSVHNFNLGRFQNLADAMAQSDGWEIVDAEMNILFRRFSLEYRDKRWYQVKGEKRA